MTTTDITTGCVVLTPDNVERIIETAAKRKWTIEHIRDSLVDNAEDGFATVLYTSVYTWIPAISNFNDAAADRDEPVFFASKMTTDEFIALLETTPETV